MIQSNLFGLKGVISNCVDGRCEHSDKRRGVDNVAVTVWPSILGTKASTPLTTLLRFTSRSQFQSTHVISSADLKKSTPVLLHRTATSPNSERVGGTLVGLD